MPIVGLLCKIAASGEPMHHGNSIPLHTGNITIVPRDVDGIRTSALLSSFAAQLQRASQVLDAPGRRLLESEEPALLWSLGSNGTIVLQYRVQQASLNNK